MFVLSLVLGVCSGVLGGLVGGRIAFWICKKFWPIE